MSDDIDNAVDDWLKRIQAKTDEINNTIDEGLLKAALYAEGQAKSTANSMFGGAVPFNDYNEDMWKHTGLLVASISSGMNPSQDHSAIVYCSAPYAKYLEYGTGIYAVAGDGRKTPWGFVSNTGVYIWTQGMSAHPFMYPSVFNNQDQIRSILASCIARVVK